MMKPDFKKYWTKTQKEKDGFNLDWMATPLNNFINQFAEECSKQEAIEIKNLLQDCFSTADISNLFTNEWINGYARALSDVEYHINQKFKDDV